MFNEEIAVPTIDANSFDEQEFLAAFSEIFTNNPLGGEPVVLIRLKKSTSEHVARINELLVNSGYREELECREWSPPPTTQELELEWLRIQRKLKQEEAKCSMGAALPYNKSFKFVPGLRPSTGHKNATHSCAA